MGSIGVSSGNYRKNFSGNSASAPQVSGVAALMLSVNPDLTESEVRTRITSNTETDSTDGTPYEGKWAGAGRLDAAKAVDAAVPPLNVSLTGPSYLNSGEQGTWTADVSGGAGSISYSWAYQPACSDSRKTFTISPNRFCGWSPLSCSGPSCSHTFFNTTGETLDGGIRVTVTGAIQSETASQTVTVSSGGSYSKAGPRASGLRSGLAARSASNEAVALTWRAEGSRLPARFVIQHRADTTGTWSRMGTVAAGDSAGADAAGAVTYRFRARDLRVGTHQFRLAYERAGQSKSARPTSAPVTARVELAAAYRLRSYPNPVRERATLELAVKEAQDVTVAVYDLLGRRVTTLHDGRLPAQETRQLSLDASRNGLSSGPYFVRVQGEGFVATERLTVVQ